MSKNKYLLHNFSVDIKLELSNNFKCISKFKLFEFLEIDGV